jgi:hypothetical protein
VQTFPGKEGKWQISTNGGSRPVWSRDGKELFYIAGDNKIMAVEVKTGAKFEHGLQKALFPIRTAPSARFEVSRDGKRFLIVDLKALDNQPPMTLLLNWYAGLRK